MLDQFGYFFRLQFDHIRPYYTIVGDFGRFMDHFGQGINQSGHNKKNISDHFGQFLVILDTFGLFAHSWNHLHQVLPSWTNLDKCGPIWSYSDIFEAIWTYLNPF